MKTILKNVLILIFSMSANEALASLETIAPVTTGAQKEFAAFLKEGNYQSALMAWSNAHGSSRFSKSDNGVALQAFLMAKNGLPAMASYWVLRDTNPRRINSKLKTEWISILETMITSHDLSLGKSLWKKELSKLEFATINSKSDIKKVQKRLSKLPKKDISGRTLLYWSLATQAPNFNYLHVAEGALKSLKELDQKLISDDQIHMALGRVLYQKGQLNEAVVEYSQVSKASDLWLESLEERAWAYVRLNEYDKATADITTLHTTTFADLVGPQVYFLANLTALKICDYPKVLENGKKFKERNIERIQEIEALASRGTNSKLPEILNRMDQMGVTLKSVGAQIKSFPRLALRSSDFKKSYSLRVQLLQEITVAQNLKNRLSVVGENQSLNSLISLAQAQSEKSKIEGLRHLKTLAREEVKEYRNIINKLKLAEVEVIHHFSVDESLKGKRGQLQARSHGSDVLVFPYDDEVWMDELDNYQARVKDCPTSKGASL